MFTALISQQVRANVALPFDESIAKYKFIKGSTYLIQINPNRHPDIRGKLKFGKRGACFLCAENQPKGERGIILDENWTVYPNPSPYEKTHVVIIRNKTYNYDPHQQFIQSKEEIMVALKLLWMVAVEADSLPPQYILHTLTSKLLSFLKFLKTTLLIDEQEQGQLLFL